LEVGLPNFQDYIILGDDVSIAHARVAEKYKSLILSLGVEISLSKRVIPTPSMKR